MGAIARYNMAWTFWRCDPKRMQEELLRMLVWLDFRLEVFIAVGIPLVLLVWSLVRNVDAVVLLVSIYWRVASLLGIALYLLIGAAPVGFLAGWLARILIPLSLWFWVDINEELDDMPPTNPLRLTLTAWRWAMTIYCGLGLILFTPLLRCTFNAGAMAANACQAWLEPPLRYRDMFHAGLEPGGLSLVGWFFLVLYAIGFGYFIIFRLTKSGRIAAEE